MRPLTAAAGPAYLFCPADRPDRYAKALAVADFVILDLEDAVAESAKPGARQALLDHPLDAARVIVRVNPVDSPHHDDDIATLGQTAYRRVMLPKVEDSGSVSKFTGFDVVALCETARGVANVQRIAEAPLVVALMWGAEDLMASLGGWSSRRADGGYLDVARHARGSVLVAAAAAGKAAIDAVFLDLADLDGLRVEAMDAAASGFVGKACIHPRQVEVVRAAFRPSPEQVAWARRVLAAAGRGGVEVVDGRMVDAPLLRQAQCVMDAAAQ